MRQMQIRKIALLGLFTAIALILGYVESLIPVFFAIPGMKLGLANVVIVICLYLLDAKETFTIQLLRIVLSAVLFGTMAGFLYSIAGGLLSFFLMFLLKKTNRFSKVTVSIAGGVFHNVGQILVAMFVLHTVKIGWYFTILWFSGMLSGALLGFLGSVLIGRLEKMHLFCDR